MDADGDGRVTREEMDIFLQQRGVDEEHRSQIVEELFDKCDRDGDNRIDLNEFTEVYLTTKNQLKEREDEIKQAIMSNNKRLKLAKQELEKAKREHGSFIQGPMGVLKIIIIRAENLFNVNNSHVICYQGNKHNQTRPAKGENPTYADADLMFEVDDDQNPLVITILDIDRGTAVFETQLTFEDIKMEVIPKNQEVWVNLRENDPSAPRLRIKLDYKQNEVLKWDSEVQMLI